MNEINLKYAREHLREVIDEVAGGGSVTLLRRGVPVARLVSVEPAEDALPSLAEFRSSIPVTGSPLSREVLAARETERY